MKRQNQESYIKYKFVLSDVNASVKMSAVAYSCDTVIMLYAIYLQLMYRYFNKTYVLMLCVVLFSLFQFASNIVTYMIVMLQFDQSEHSHSECNRNVTNWVTWSLELICVMWPRELHNLLSLLLLLLLLSPPTLSPLQSTHHHAVSDRCFLHLERLYIWQNRTVGVDRQIWIFWSAVGREWAKW